ncbi:hypothetical protein Dda_3928 [Drechslerella dactyloides]|uniref:Uncharacterized protein n=1 Tax=Drechslerella dactyloides TaxID=74499 RepID=A0AAD6IYW0_DREDA|nr:hypothetical protein Dda_3928 [Drechslerella dactyloides]
MQASTIPLFRAREDSKKTRLRRLDMLAFARQPKSINRAFLTLEEALFITIISRAAVSKRNNHHSPVYLHSVLTETPSSSFASSFLLFAKACKHSLRKLQPFLKHISPHPPILLCTPKH